MFSSVKETILIIGTTIKILSKYIETVNFQAYLSLGCAVLLLTVYGFIVFGYAMDPTWHKWVCKERGGLSVEVFKQCPLDRMLANLFVDIVGNIAISVFLVSTFAFSSYLEATSTAILIYSGSVFPNLHHYLWEDRSMPLIIFTELYQLSRRVLLACSMLFFSGLFNESLANTNATFGGPTTVFPNGTLIESLSSVKITPFLILTAIRFVLGFLWYGPIFGFRTWLPAMRKFKRNDKWPETTDDMPKLLLIGTLCGQIQSLFLLPLEKNINAVTTLADATGFGCVLWAMFVLPTMSVDMWEGKGYAIPFVNYSLYLVELVVLSVVAFLYYGD